MWRHYWFKLKWWRKKQSLQQCNALTDVIASFGVKNALRRDCYAWNFLCEGIVDYLNALSSNFTKWSNTLKQLAGKLQRVYIKNYQFCYGHINTDMLAKKDTFTQELVHQIQNYQMTLVIMQRRSVWREKIWKLCSSSHTWFCRNTIKCNTY